MKTRIEDAANAHATQMRGEDFSDVSNNVNFELMKQSFRAGAEFMQKEVDALKAQMTTPVESGEEYVKRVPDFEALNKKLKVQNKVAIEALESLRSICAEQTIAFDVANNALLKL